MNHGRKEDVDLSLYLPFDVCITNFIFFKRLKPKAWVIAKYDVWPGIILAAHWANVPVLLCSAELAEDSMRYKGVNAIINRLFYKYITYILPVSEDYKQRFLNIFPYENRLEVVGDARYDQIIAKAEAVMQQPEVQLFENPLPITFIGGSLWPADEKHLFPALLRIFKEHDNLQLLLVPHELHESHIQAIEQTFRQEGIETQRYTDFANTGNGKTTCRVAIINKKKKKKIGFHPENHILKSIEFLLVYCLSTFNSLLPEELIKWTIDLHSLCTFIKGTTTLLYVRLIMPVSSERPTAWMGPECISRYNGSATVPGLEHNAKLKG